MFKRPDKQHGSDMPSASSNSSLNLLTEKIDNAPVTNPGDRRSNVFPMSSRSTTSPDRSSYWDASSDDTRTFVNSSNPTTRPRSRPIDSGSTLTSSALQSAYERGAESATTAEVQIVADKMEVVHLIANYAVEPSEMLHLVDRWLQQLISEFKQQRDQFKYKLNEKWLNEELPNLTYDNNERIRKIYTAYKELETAQNTTLSQESFDNLNNYLRRIDDSQTDEMKERFNSLVQEYSKIVRCLEFVDREIKTNISGDDNYLNDIKMNLSKLKQLNNKQSHTICIVGLEKAGKSTFINALLGFELVPTASERCTQVRTVLKPPMENGDQQLFATVKFYSDEEFRLFFDQMIKKTDETQQQFDARKAQVMTVRENLRTKFPEEDFRINTSSDVNRERENIRTQLYEYITGEVYVNIIKEISIYTDKLPGKNYELLDVPGFDSPIKEHRDAGLEAIKTADAFLFLTNGQQPSLTQPQISLLDGIQRNHFEAMQRAFGIITKLDLCQTPANYEDHYNKSCNELIEKKFKREHIYVACPRLQILEKNSDEYRVIEQKLNNFGSDLVNGFEKSKEALNRFIEYELPKTHLKQLVELGRMRLVRPVIERLDQIKEKQLLPQNLGNMSVDEYIKQQKIESWDQVYDDNIFKPAFARINQWHTIIVTKERNKFIDDVKQTFHDSFLERTKDFLQSKHDIEQVIFEEYDFSKLQLNSHPTDNRIRKELSFQLEKIVDATSDVLGKHFYHKYICGLENILNNVCSYLKDLYRPKLTLEKCLNETHALILRVCRPLLTATLRYSHLDSLVKQNAIKELIYIAPTVAYNIANASDQDRSKGILRTNIQHSVEVLVGQNDMTTSIIRTLFQK